MSHPEIAKLDFEKLHVHNQFGDGDSAYNAATSARNTSRYFAEKGKNVFTNQEQTTGRDNNLQSLVPTSTITDTLDKYSVNSKGS